MYSEFTALPLLKSERSVLDRLSYSAGVLVAAQIVDDLCHQLSNNQQPNFLNDDDLKWFMQVIDFSLGLTFSTDYPTIRHSVRLYCDWISCVTNNPNKFLPKPLLDQPFFYASKMINHLLQLFAPSIADTLLSAPLEADEEDSSLLPGHMSPAIVSQTWLRILKLIDEPITFLRCVFSHQEAIKSSTDSSSACDSHLQHYSPIYHWQYSFYRMMRGIYCVISGLLGEPIDCTFKEPEKALKEVNISLNHFLSGQQPAGAPAQQSVSLIKAAMSLGSSTRGKIKAAQPSRTIVTINHLSDSVMISAILKSLSFPSKKSDYSIIKPLAETLCKLFSDWLFDVAGSKIQNLEQRKYSSFENDTISQKSQGSQQSSEVENVPATKNSTSQQNEVRMFLESLPSVNGYQAGKAEAVAALCKIFSSKSCPEVLPEYTLCRFYSILSDILTENDTIITSYVIVHSIDLFRVNLRGAESLVPYFLDCLDVLCIEPDKTKIHPSLTDICLRSACLKMLSSLVSLPTFYGDQKLADINSNMDKISFISLRSKILRVILHELKIETDSQNLQLCLCIASVFCYASWLWEEKNKQLLGQQSPSESTHYLNEILRLCLPTVWDSLRGKWNSDYAVCLAAIDYFCFLSGFLSGKADGYLLNVANIVLHLCTFIEIQLSKPPPAHSRDLHSTVVGAYYCLETLLVNSPDVLKSENCLRKVCDVVQLGMTGTKAESPSADDLDIRTNKNPASQRVYDAAEQLLHTLFNRINQPFVMCSSPEDEDLVLSKAFKNSDNIKIRYFLIEETAILGLTNISTDDDAPSTALVVRSPFDRASCWIVKFKNVEDGKPSVPNVVQRPQGEDVQTMKFEPFDYFPAEVNKLEKLTIDKAFPAELENTPEMVKLGNLVNNYFNKLKPICKSYSFPDQDIKPEGFKNAVNGTELYLYSLGYLNPTDDQIKCQELNSDLPNFRYDLASIVDNCPPRLIHTVHVFYVNRKKTSAVDILQNGIDLEFTSLHFRSLLSDLGVGINVRDDQLEDSDRSGYLLDGISNALYFATPLIEIAFLVPTIRSYKLVNRNRAQTSPHDIIRLGAKDLKHNSVRFSTLTESSSKKIDYFNHIMKHIYTEEDDSCFTDENVTKQSFLEGEKCRFGASCLYR
uniref:Rap-GAP domain-containing protein n=1 Tax=Romanomermis culicivorax TaxID=13658 RepID=A0A915JX14_ROMCU